MDTVTGPAIHSVWRHVRTGGFYKVTARPHRHSRMQMLDDLHDVLYHPIADSRDLHVRSVPNWYASMVEVDGQVLLTPSYLSIRFQMLKNAIRRWAYS